MISTLENVRLKDGDRVSVQIGDSFYPAKVLNASDPSKLRVELTNGSVLWVGRLAVGAVLEYVLVKESEWSDFCAVAQERGLEVEYSIEDSPSGEGIEYHVHSHLEESEEILSVIHALNGAGSDIQITEPAIVDG
jgi:hypothetical protein